MKYLIFILFLLPVKAMAQGPIPIRFASTAGRPYDTGFTENLRVNSSVRLPFYGTADTSKVLGIDAQGRLTVRTKGNATSGISGLSVNNIPRAASATTLTTSNIWQVGSYTGLANSNPTATLDVIGTIKTSILAEFTDDAAAATGGIAVGQYYRTGSFVKQRIN